MTSHAFNTEAAFRSEVRAFLEKALPSSLRRKVVERGSLAREDIVAWQRILGERGWLAPTWPVEWGGTGWSARQAYVFDEECWLAGAPEVPPFGLKMLAPVLMQHGSAAQKDFFLPRILSSEHWWCQGYSEPNSGSDLASLKSRGTLEGDHLVIEGQKIWTTLAHYATHIFCLVRTDATAKPQDGISFVLVDMKTPGVTVRPLILFDGVHAVNEVFLDRVRVPLSNVVGELHKGWRYAKALLGHERFGVGNLGRPLRELALLKRMAEQPDALGRRWMDDLRFAERIAAIEVDILAVEQTTLRMMRAAGANSDAGVESSLLKLRGTEIAQQVSALLVEALGPYQPSVPVPADGDSLISPRALVRQYLNWRKLTIAGGSSEVQRNIIAKFALGL